MNDQLFILLEFIIILLTVLITRSLIQKPIKKDTPPPEEPKAPVYIEVPENTTNNTDAFEDEQEKARQDVAARLQAWQDLINEDDK